MPLRQQIISQEDVVQLARMAGLAINPAYLPEVARNLTVLFEQADFLMTPSIDPLIEPAPVFLP